MSMALDGIMRSAGRQGFSEEETLRRINTLTSSEVRQELEHQLGQHFHGGIEELSPSQLNDVKDALRREALKRARRNDFAAIEVPNVPNLSGNSVQRG